MLSAVRHSHRPTLDLAGYWHFCIDPDDRGADEKWYQDGSATDWDTLYVPANWNEQRGRYDGYMGKAWYRRRIFIPATWQGQRLNLVVQGALHTATVWVNGQRLAEHEGGFTPFEVDVSETIAYGADNTIAICVDDTVSLESIPQGTSQYQLHIDWYNWGGLYRPIYLESSSPTSLADLTIRTLQASTREAQFEIQGQIAGPDADHTTVRLALLDAGGVLVAEAAPGMESGQGEFRHTWMLDDAHLWSPDDPYLYTLRVEIIQDGAELDYVEFTCGIRTIVVEGGQLLLNGRPFFLKGISRVEDAPIQGRASVGPVPRRDYDLLTQCHANIYRPAGYFPSIPDVMLADQTGIGVILDVPNYGKLIPETLDNPQSLAKVKRWVHEAVAVYKNHPGVLLWDLATEPRTITEGGRVYIQTLYDLVRSLDPTRPVFYIWHCLVYKEDKAQDIVDMLCLWIGQRLHDNWEAGVRIIEEQVEYMHNRYPDKPMILYFGDVAVPGQHSDPPRWYSEEFQARYFEWAWAYAQTKPYVVGFWWWCLADYRCRPASSINGQLRWGIYDRQRQPKLTARLIQNAYPARPTLAKEE